MNARRFETISWKAAPLAIALVPALACVATACGSMTFAARNPSRADTFTTILTAAIVPVIVFVIAELATIRRFAKVGREQSRRIYIYTLPAKACGLAAVSFGTDWKLIANIIVAEAIYSVVHFAASYLVLTTKFKGEVADRTTVAFATSTLIPWSFSLVFGFSLALSAVFGGL